MEDSNEFQIKNMLYKMKKIKKKKCNNIQKIEAFEVLENINREPRLKEGMIPNLSKKDEEEEKPINKSADPTVKETREEPIDENDSKWWDGLDEIKSEAGDLEKGMADDLSDIVNKIYIRIITFNCMIALSISTGKPKGAEYIKKNNVVNINLNKAKFGKALNNNPIVKGNSDLNDNDVNDANIIFQWICVFEALISAHLFTVIWFYVIFYSYAENTTLNSIFDSLTREKFKESTNFFVTFIFFFIEYAIVILDDIRWVLSYLMPKYVGKYLGKPMCYILLYIIISYFNHNFLTHFKDLLIDTIKLKMHTNIIIIFLYFIAFGEYLLRFKRKNINPDDPIAKASLSLDVLTTYLDNNIFTLIYKFFKELLRLIFLVAVAVPLGTFLFIFYFFWISIFTGITKIWRGTILKEIVRFIRSDSEYKGRDPCDIPRSYFEQLWFGVKDSFSNLSMFIYSNLLYIILLLYSLYALGVSSYISNSQAQQGVMITHMVILGFTLLFWFTAIRKYSKQNTLGLTGLFVLPPEDLFNDVYKNGAYFSGLILLVLFVFSMVIVGKSS